ncbi:MAG: sugar phosphate isomerase/epimerase family protein [Terriglobales bacterium]
MKQHPELTVAYWTIAGAFPGAEREYSPFDFKDRVEAAARAGFTGMGIWHADLEHILERRTLQEMKQILDDNGMRHLEVEFLTDWFVEGEPKKQSDVRKKNLLEAAEALHAKQIKVGDFYRRKCPMPRLIDAFAALCAEAAEHGSRIAFEPMAVSMVNTLQDSLAMVEGAAAKNGGIVLDLWHVLNLGISYEEVGRIPVQYVFGAEVNDGNFNDGNFNDGALKTRANAHRELIVNRKFCGEGEFDIRSFIEAVERTGYIGPWGVEIFSEDLLTLPLEELTTRAFNTSMTLMEK